MSRVPGYLEVDGEWYSESTAQQAVRYAKKRGKLNIITPNPDRAVLYPELPPAKHVGGGLRYAVAPGIPSEVRIKLSNIDLPRGEAGDDFTDLKKRVEFLEQRSDAIKIWIDVTDRWIAKIQDWYHWMKGTND